MPGLLPIDPSAVPAGAIPYRAEIDGLRAIAVLAVVLFHADVPLMQGGFVGVDMFFVISGHLITLTWLAAGAASPAAAVLAFYGRRIRRILPALLVVLAVTAVAAWALMLPADLGPFSATLLGAALFGANLVLWRQEGYFNAAAELKPLLHTWSLGVEEQFYLLFPALMLLLASRRMAGAVVLAGLAAGSLALAQATVAAHPSAAFYLLPTRAWELLLGVACAWLMSRRRLPVAPPWLGWLGLGMVLVSLVGFSQATQTPSLATLLPTVGTALLLLGALPGTRLGRLLGQPALVAVGLLSYSLYLWHQPVLALARYRSAEPLGPAAVAACVLLSLALAMLTWRMVELPCRSRLRVPGHRLALGIGLGTAALLVLGLVLHRDLAGARSWVRAQPLAWQAAPAASAALAARADGADVVVWGDSHADALAAAVADHFARLGLVTHARVMHSCPPVLQVLRNEPARLGAAFAAACQAHNAAAMAEILHAARAPRPVRLVVLSGAWGWYLGGRNWSGEPIVLDPRQPGLAAEQHLPGNLRQTVDTLRASGIQALVVLPHPAALQLDGMLRSQRYRSEPVLADVDAARRHAAVVRSAFGGQDASLLDTAAVLCGAQAKRCDLMAAGPEQVYLRRDGSHLSPAGADRLAAAIVERWRATSDPAAAVPVR